MISTLILSLVVLAQDAEPASDDTDGAQPVDDAVAVESQTEDTEADPLLPTAFDRDMALAGVNGWLNGIDTYQARFDQIAPDGSASGGTVYIRRPGRLRFEYDPPTPLLVVADGTTVAIEDSDLNTVDRVPLNATPLWWILKDDVDLANDTQVNDVWVEDNRLYVAAEDSSGEVDGLALFVFHPETYVLEEWFVRDSLGYTTRIILSNAERDMPLSPRLFVLDDPGDDRRGRRR